MFVCFLISYHDLKVSLGAQVVKNLPAMRETQVRSLGWKDPREKEMATQFSILAQGIMDREAWWATYSPRGRKESDMAEQLTRHHDLSQKKNPLQN